VVSVGGASESAAPVSSAGDVVDVVAAASEAVLSDESEVVAEVDEAVLSVVAVVEAPAVASFEAPVLGPESSSFVNSNLSVPISFVVADLTQRIYSLLPVAKAVMRMSVDG